MQIGAKNWAKMMQIEAKNCRNGANYIFDQKIFGTQSFFGIQNFWIYNFSELNFFSDTKFLGSMLPQYMALSVSLVSFMSQKIKLGHFEARYEVELWYADCSHKYKIN